MTAVLQSDLDELALSIVCVERVPMTLTGPDRIEAIRRLSARGVCAGDIAALLRISHKLVTTLQIRNGIKPAPVPRDTWWAAYNDPRRKRRT